jgi:hypothetical protein
MKGKLMGYSETIKNVITNITTQNDIYVNITSTTRMHIYKEDLDKTWYIVACEVLKNKKYIEESNMSACNIEDLKRIVGISYMYCKEI